MSGGGHQERKFATAFFVDIVGYTSLVEQHDPEIVDALVRRVFARLGEEISRHGGLVERTAGDAILVLFGVPAAHEDDPERAVRAALQCHAVLAELNREFAGEGKPELQIRVGIEAGDVLVDLDQVAGSRDRMVTGDAVNVSARLQALAAPGGVVVGPRAHSLTKEVVDYEPAGTLALKGKGEPVQAWTAARLRGRFRGERPAMAVEAGLIGRDEELGILTRSLERVQSEGRPLLTTILGPPGAGKSRLVRELADHVEMLPDTYYWRSGRCRAYGDVAYSALVDLVKAQCEIVEDDSAEVVEAKIERAVGDLDTDRSVASALHVLVSASEHSFTREQLFDAWESFFERMAARYPLVLVFEDIHWADDGLLDFIGYLADWAQGPIMLLTAARPDLLEKQVGWGGGKRNYSAIYLDALSGPESEAMLDELTDGCLPPSVKNTVFARSEGNPLFTEEIVRMFIDKEALTRTTGGWQYVPGADEPVVPTSIQSLIAARLDALPSEEKMLMQQASIIGRVFWSGAVADLSGISTEGARETLRSLQLKEFVVPRSSASFSNQHEFSFHHVLIRDIAYESLPKSTRAAKHQVVARWLEREAGDRPEDLAATIASHYEAAARYQLDLGEVVSDDLARQAYTWARAAGERSLRVGDAAEGTRWYACALDLVEPARVPIVERAHLWESYALSSSRRLPPDQVDKAFEEAIDHFRNLGMERDVARVETAIANYMIETGRDEDTRWVDRALARLEPEGDSEDLARALSTKGRHLFLHGEFVEAEPLLRRSLELAERFDSLLVQAQVKTSLGSVIRLLGREGEGLALVEEALELARAAGDPATYTRALNNFILATRDIEDFARYDDLQREGIELARKAGDLGGESWLCGSFSWLMTERGRMDEALEHARRCEECARAMNSPSHLGLAYLRLARVMFLRDDLEEAGRLCRESAIGKGHPSNEPLRHQLEGLIAVTRGDVETGVQHLLRSFDLRSGGSSGESSEWPLIEVVRALVRAGRNDQARPHRDKLHELASTRAHVRRFVLWADGLLADDPVEQIERLERAIEAFVSIGWAQRRGMATIDLGRAHRRAGNDPRPVFASAREILRSAGAEVHVREAEEELARADGGSHPADPKEDR